MNYLVSVVIPVAPNEGRLEQLSRAIESVNRQTYEQLEIVVIQDGPGKIIAEYLKPIKSKHSLEVYNFPVRCGPAAARNYGVDVAKGRYIAFLDSDDEWMPDKIRLQVASFTNTEIGVVGCDSFSVNVATGEKKKKEVVGLRGNVFKCLALTGAGIQTSMLMVRRDYFQNIGGFDINKTFGEEKDLQLRLAQIYKFGWVDEPMGIQYFNHQSDQLSFNIDNCINGVQDFYSDWKDIVYKFYGDDGLRSMRQWLYSYLINARKRQFERNNKLRSRLEIFIKIYNGKEFENISILEIGKLLLIAIAGPVFVRLRYKFRKNIF